VRAGLFLERVQHEAVGVRAARENLVQHPSDGREILAGLLGIDFRLPGHQQPQAADDLAPVVAQSSGHKSAGLQVVVGESLAPLEELPLAGHRVEPREHLELLAVDFDVVRGDLAERRIDGGVFPDVFHDGPHAVEPLVPAGHLDDGHQAVLDVLAAAVHVLGFREETFRAVGDLGVQRVADRPVERFQVGRPGGPDQERVAVRPGILVVERAIRMVEARVRFDLLEGDLVQPALDLAEGIAGDRRRGLGLLEGRRFLGEGWPRHAETEGGNAGKQAGGSPHGSSFSPKTSASKR